MLEEEEEASQFFHNAECNTIDNCSPVYRGGGGGMRTAYLSVCPPYGAQLCDRKHLRPSACENWIADINRSRRNLMSVSGDGGGGVCVWVCVGGGRGIGRLV